MRTPDLTVNKTYLCNVSKCRHAGSGNIFFYLIFNFGGCVHYTYAYNKIFFLTDPIYDNYIFVLCIFKEESKVFLWVWFVRISII